MSFWRKVLGVLDSIELGFFALLGTALFAGLIIGVPATLAWTLIGEGRFWTAGLLVVLLFLAIVRVVWDLAARRWSWLSVGLAGLWIGCALYVGLGVW